MYKVMLVDDEHSVCVGMQKLINWKQYGFEVVATASNGREALALLEERAFDLIITDLKMPVVGGLELIRTLAERQYAGRVIIVSAYGEFSYAQEAMRYGVQYYLLKPVNETVLEGYLSKIAEDIGDGTQVADENVDHSHMEHQYRLSAYGVIPEMRSYINEHFGESLSLNYLAKLYSFNAVYLGRLFKKETGMSFNEYLNRCRINAACEFMEQSDSTISDVATKVGYTDINYFYKCFKAQTGKTPSEYRKGGG